MSTEDFGNAAAAGRFIDRLTGAPALQRRELLTDFLRDQLGYAVEIDKMEIALDDRLMDLGIDSLKAVEVKLYLEEELGIELGSSLLFDYPTLEGLVGFLLKEAGLAGHPAAEAGAGRETPADRVDVPVDLSEEQLADLLEAELALLRREA